MHMLVLGSGGLVGSALFGPILLPMALGYIGGFLLAAALPNYTFAILISAHLCTAATAYVLFHRRT